MLLFTLTISTLFIHVPDVGRIEFLGEPMMTHPCTGERIEIGLSYNQWFWMFAEHLILVTMACIILDQAGIIAFVNGDEWKSYRKIIYGYLLITIADTVLWVMFYTDPLGNYILTWNILKTVLFVGVMWYERKQLFGIKGDSA